MIDVELSVFAILAFILIGLVLTGMILYARAYLIKTTPCLIRINDKEELSREVVGGQTLLAALTKEGFAIPSPCGGKATCKQCRVRVMEGGGEILETDRATFSPKELTLGWRLSCQCKVKEDLKIKLPESMLSLKKIEAVVLSNENVATFIKELVVQIESPIQYIPGDYLQFHVNGYQTSTSEWKGTMNPKYHTDWERFGLFNQQIVYRGDEVIRAYSMASYPKEGNLLKFNIRIATPPFQGGKMIDAPWGICSSYIFMLKPGDKVTLSGPFGESHMIDSDQELIFLIGGAGASFGRSHILDLFYTHQTKRKVTLWYGARSLKENIYQAEYEALAEQFPNFTYRLVLSEPTPEDVAAGWPKNDPLKTAFLFKAFRDGQLNQMDTPENCLYYVCGPPMHNSSILKMLDEYGVPKDNIILDDFGN
ncbi:MAG: NADH:ubiquinone reductase (Na(+)-transporting) subunit F [Simkaniaceae bacterium]|nr:NADH:ubiquinone reductase (Na(+)-transporting) subunit F [Simkaniaceae bacterium]